jgi:hypothetical protein
MSDNLAGEDGWFFCSADTMENETTISAYKQAKCYKKLEEAGLIETKLKGLPAIKHFRIKDLTILLEDLETTTKTTKKQDFKKLENLYKETSKQDVKKLDTINITNQYNNQYKDNRVSFKKFLEVYPSNRDEQKAYSVFHSFLNEEEKQKAIDKIPIYLKYLEVSETQKFLKAPANYLKDKTFNTDWEKEIGRIQKYSKEPEPNSRFKEVL